MGKIHHTKEYYFYPEYPIGFITKCGIDSRKSKHFISPTILNSQVTCKKCLQILNKK